MANKIIQNLEKEDLLKLIDIYSKIGWQWMEFGFSLLNQNLEWMRQSIMMRMHGGNSR